MEPWPLLASKWTGCCYPRWPALTEPLLLRFNTCCDVQVDGVLLSHPQVAEAVSFAAPDEKYGEVVSHVYLLSLAWLQ